MNKNMVDKFKQAANEEDFIVLLLSNATDVPAGSSEIVKYFTSNLKIPGVYVTLNKPFTTIKRNFEKAKINTKMLIFIDGISESNHKVESKKEGGCLYIPTPKSLSDLSIAINEAVLALPSKNKFLFLDSLTTLLIYNEEHTVTKFVHFITTKIRDWEINGVILSVDKKADSAIVSQLGQFVDLVFDYSKEGK